MQIARHSVESEGGTLSSRDARQLRPVNDQAVDRIGLVHEVVERIPLQGLHHLGAVLRESQDSNFRSRFFGIRSTVMAVSRLAFAWSSSIRSI